MLITRPENIANPLSSMGPVNNDFPVLAKRLVIPLLGCKLFMEMDIERHSLYATIYACSRFDSGTAFHAHTRYSWRFLDRVWVG